MATRATNVITSDAYLGIKRALSQLNVNVDAWIPNLQATGADYGFIYGMYRTLRNADEQIDELKITPGLADYAQAQEDDLAYDFQVELTATLVAITDAYDWIATNIPLTNRTLNAMGDLWDGGVGTIIVETFTPAQTSGLQTLLQAVTDSIT